MKKDVTINDVITNVLKCTEHVHEKHPVKETVCPFCGYHSSEWCVDEFGWPECPNCGAT